MIMNPYRIAGDFSHTVALFVLLYQLCAKNARGVSAKTQELYLMVFLARYLDLFFMNYSLYDSLMKILYISITSVMVYMIRTSMTYDKDLDSFQHWKYAVAPCIAITVAANWYQQNEFSVFFGLEFFWLFSVFLEAVAILPQLKLLRRYREVDNLTIYFVLFMGIYRVMYIANWVYKAYNDALYPHNWLLYASSAIQVCFYADFLWHYFLRSKRAEQYYGSCLLRTEDLSGADDAPVVLADVEEQSLAAASSVLTEPLMKDNKGEGAPN